MTPAQGRVFIYFIRRSAPLHFHLFPLYGVEISSTLIGQFTVRSSPLRRQWKSTLLTFDLNRATSDSNFSRPVRTICRSRPYNPSIRSISYTEFYSDRLVTWARCQFWRKISSRMWVMSNGNVLQFWVIFYPECLYRYHLPSKYANVTRILESQFAISEISMKLCVKKSVICEVLKSFLLLRFLIWYIKTSQFVIFWLFSVIYDVLKSKLRLSIRGLRGNLKQFVGSWKLMGIDILTQ